MPIRASFFFMVCLALTISGCSLWPGPEHRDLTLADIEHLLDQKIPAAEPAKVVAVCADTSSLDDKLRRQRLQLLRINKQLQSLAAASPTFSAAQCPPGEAPATQMDGKIIIGASEWIYLSPPGHHYQARIDSGAATSSLSAVNVVRFERNGKRWVRFWLQHDDEAEPIEIEAPLIRHVLIRQASSDAVDRRPVVSLTVNLGTALQQDTEFTLTDRSQMTYPILLGREFLRDVTLIDVGARFLHAKFVPDTVPASVVSTSSGQKKITQPTEKNTPDASVVNTSVPPDNAQKEKTAGHDSNETEVEEVAPLPATGTENLPDPDPAPHTP